MGTILNLEKRRQERILKSISEKFRHPLFDLLPICVGAIDYEGRYVGLNNSCGSALGVTTAQLIAEKTIYDVTEPHDHERIKKIIEVTIDEGECDWFETNWLGPESKRFAFPSGLTTHDWTVTDGKTTGSFETGWAKMKAVEIDGVELLLGIVLFSESIHFDSIEPKLWGFTPPP